MVIRRLIFKEDLIMLLKEFVNDVENNIKKVIMNMSSSQLEKALEEMVLNQ
jgi:hypothetical protein